LSIPESRSSGIRFVPGNLIRFHGSDFILAK
jgi:hypothetical protein